MSLEKDPVSGTEMTGHEWDGIRELNTPVPWPSRWALRITIVIAVLFWIFYPAWPYFTDFTRGLLGYSTRGAVLSELAEAKAQRAETFAPFATKALSALADDPDLRSKYEGSIANLYADNCAACHGADLKGQTGFPDLTDAYWLWSGSPEEIEATIRYGINASHDDTRVAQMLAFGKEDILDKDQVHEVTEFVLSLSDRSKNAHAATAGATVFEENCASCHGEDAKSGLEVGAPNLTDDFWIYGGSADAIHESIWSGREGVMPAWSPRLSDEQIRMLTLYVVWAGNDGSN